MLRRVLIIDLADKLPLIVVRLLTKSDFAARIVGLRKSGGHFHRDGTELRRIDAVIHVRSSQCDLPAAVAGR